MVNRILNIAIFILISIFIYYLFIPNFIPSLGNVELEVIPTKLDSQLQIINITLTNPAEKYYLLLHEDDIDSNWIYITPTLSSREDDYIIKNFLNEEIEQYVFIEGDSSTLNYTFNIKSKYPISYIANKNYEFHLQYIVPYKFLFFPTFYYNKHFVFFVDPIM
ncbi:MAG: hypothetical protein ATN32_01600 [Candidatus Epulonipiscium fishelsonii]|nr:MAG: hypothetical protein ATN32_01600 [Epulopiscium sp. AS2M-Bin002]